ncbi:MAG: hypothetical protein ACM3XM_15675 [Mycobacterium leprae]
MKIWHIYRNGRPVPAAIDGVGQPAWPGRPMNEPADDLTALLGPGIAMSLPALLHADPAQRPPGTPRY